MSACARRGVDRGRTVSRARPGERTHFGFGLVSLSFGRTNAAGEASSAGGGVRWGPNGARGWFVGGCTHVIDPRYDVQDLSARLAALAACARSVTRKIPEVESAGISATLFVPLGASSLDPKISSGLRV